MCCRNFNVCSTGRQISPMGGNKGFPTVSFCDNKNNTNHFVGHVWLRAQFACSLCNCHSKKYAGIEKEKYFLEGERLQTFYQRILKEVIKLTSGLL